jgi:ribosomal protein L19
MKNLNNLNNYINETFYIDNDILDKIFIGSIIYIKYNLYNSQNIIYEGLVIGYQGNTYNKVIKIKYNIDNKFIEHSFPICSPNFLTVELKEKIKVHRSKLYYLRCF